MAKRIRNRTILGIFIGACLFVLGLAQLRKMKRDSEHLTEGYDAATVKE